MRYSAPLGPAAAKVAHPARASGDRDRYSPTASAIVPADAVYCPVTGSDTALPANAWNSTTPGTRHGGTRSVASKPEPARAMGTTVTPATSNDVSSRPRV